jgi:hypothetical protein
MVRSDGRNGAVIAGSNNMTAMISGRIVMPVRPRTQPADPVETTTAIDPQTRTRPKSTPWLRTAITA